jgi:hypothetical protein
MATIDYHMPTLVKISESSAFGSYRPGVEVVKAAIGESKTRTWSDYNQVSYEVRFEMLKQSEDGLKDLKWFMGSTAMQGAFWFPEPITGDHFEMICGPLGDASRTCFPLPIYGTATNALAFVEDEIQMTGVTFHDAANMLAADKYAAVSGATDASDFLCVQGTDALQENFGLATAMSIKVTPNGGGTGLQCYPVIPSAPAVSPGDELTMIVAIYETKSAARSFNPGIYWYDSGDGFLGSSLAGGSAATSGEWTIYTHTATAPANTAKALPAFGEANNDTDVLFHDCWALAPGTYDRWHLPSSSPGVIELASAPALGERVTANASGTRVSRVRRSTPAHANEMYKPGHAIPSRMRLFEAVEF